MGFSNQERINLNSKVLAAGVKDANEIGQWYETFFPNRFTLSGNSVWTKPDLDILLNNPAPNVSTARALASANPTIIEDLSDNASAIRLTEVTGSNGSTYVAFSTYDDLSSDQLTNWIQPQLIPRTDSGFEGFPSIGYAVRLFEGDPNAGGTEIFTSSGQTGSGELASVGWIFDYANGMLLVSSDFRASITNPYILGFRYIGSTSNKSNISINHEGTQVVNAATTLNFTGGVNVTDDGYGVAVIEITTNDAHQEQPAVSDNQTSFTLNNTPIKNNTVMMFINGIKQEYDVDYSASGTSVTYLGTPSLLSTDVVEFWYLVDSGGAGGSGSFQTLTETLSFGNETDGYDIVVSSGDEITNINGSNLFLTTQNNVGGTANSIRLEPGDGNIGGGLFLIGGTGSSGTGGGVVLNGGPGTTSGGSFTLTAGSGSSGSGGSFSIASGNGSTNGGGMSVSLGNSTSTGNGGSYSFTAGNGSGVGGVGGQFTFTGGNAGTNANGGQVKITSGAGNGSGLGGALDFDAGSNNGSGTAGAVTISGGNNSSTGNGGNAVLSAGNSSSGQGGSVTISAGTGGGGDGSILLDTKSSGKLVLSSTNAVISTNDTTLTGGTTNNITFQSGDVLVSGTSGNVSIESGSSANSGSTGSITIKSGAPTSGTGNGSGSVSILTSPNSSATGTTGSISLITGDGNGGSSGAVVIGSGAGQTGSSGDVKLYVGTQGSSMGNMYLLTGKTTPNAAPAGTGNVYFEPSGIFKVGTVASTNIELDVGLNNFGAGGDVVINAGNSASGAGGGDIDLTAGTGSPNGTINLNSTTNITGNLTVTGRGSIQYTVGTANEGANFSTIQAAINQAVADGANANNPAEIIIFPGYYPENLTASNGGIALSGVANEWGVFIDGTITFTNNSSASNIWMLSDIGVAGAVTITGTAGGSFLAIEIKNCSLFSKFTSTQNAQIRIKSSLIQTGAVDPIVVSTSTSNNSVRIYDTIINGTTSGRAISSSVLDIRNCKINGFIEILNHGSTNSTIANCTIYTVSTHGVLVNQASPRVTEITNCTISKGGTVGPVITKLGTGRLERTMNGFFGSVSNPPVSVSAGTDVTGKSMETQIGPYLFPTNPTQVFEMPSADGYDGQVLSTDGSGNLTFVDHGIDEFTNSEAGGGNPTLSVAPQDTHQVSALATASSADYDTDTGANGYFQFTVLAVVKLASAGTYRRVSATIDAIRSGGTLTTSGSQVNLSGGDGTNITLTLTASTGSLRANLSNTTGETVNGYVNVSWSKTDEIA